MVGIQDRKFILNDQIEALNHMVDEGVNPVDIKSYRGTVLTAAKEAKIDVVVGEDGKVSYAVPSPT